MNYFVPEVIAASGDRDVLLIGDMNAHGFEDPIHVMTEAGYVNQLERFVRPQGIPYSYVFDGVSGYLDHALASPTLNAQVVDATFWHTNADEPTVLDYNTDRKNAAAQALFAGDAYRSSDHDPVVVSLNLPTPPLDLTASVSIARSELFLDRDKLSFTATMTFTNKQASALDGPFYVTFDNLSPGVTLLNASGVKDGVPYIMLNRNTIPVGGKMTVPVRFSTASEGTIAFTNKVYTGNF